VIGIERRPNARHPPYGGGKNHEKIPQCISDTWLISRGFFEAYYGRVSAAIVSPKSLFLMCSGLPVCLLAGQYTFVFTSE